MKKLACFIPCIVGLCSLSLQAQLTVNTGLTTAQLAPLLTGFGVSITNVQINCNPGSYGEFSGNSEIPITHGLMLSTGYIHDITGPNTADNTSGDNAYGSDFSLNNEVAPAQTYNACVIEFDCIPQGDTLMFNFGFGSEEYPEYVGSEFNDVFAIYCTDTSGNTTNVALIPNTSLPVSINNVNHLNHQAYYINNSAGQYIGFDGLTQNLQAFAVVVPGSVYHFKIAVADVSDAIYDSGVLLEAFSFRSIPVPASVEEVLSTSFAIYPIPADDYIQLRSKTGLPAESIAITDAWGRTVLNQNIQSTSAMIDVSTLTQGMYILTTYTAQGKFSKKISIR